MLMLHDLKHDARCLTLFLYICDFIDHFEPDIWLSIYLDFAYRLKFTVTGGNCCKSGRCDLEREFFF